MVNFRIGCAGWQYKDWINSFYPKTLEKSNYLTYYSKYFNFNEINSTFYQLPSTEIISGWNEKVDKQFKFSIKVWKKITHESDSHNLEDLLIRFFNNFNILRKRIKVFLFQFPPWFRFSAKNVRKLNQIIENLPQYYKYTFEFRDISWFKEKNSINSPILNNLNLTCSYLDKIPPYYKKNQKFYYIRLIGDRTLENFQYVQRSMKNELTHLMKNLKILRSQTSIKEIFIIVNNHFTGFAPETVNKLKTLLNLAIKKFPSQKHLADYF